MNRPRALVACVPMFLLIAIACTQPDASDLQPEVHDSVADTAPMESYVGPAYSPCVSDAQCDAGDACASVPGYAGLYCAPPCDPADPADPVCDLPGLDFDTECMSNGRCARACGEPDSCPEELACQDDPEPDAQALCTGVPFGGAGLYGLCNHPNAEGTDCPLETSCFGGDYLNTPDQGVCLPWCDTGECPSPPDDSVGVSPICYDVGLPHPSCALICSPGSSTCPEGQECFDLGFIGLCAPPGANY